MDLALGMPEGLLPFTEYTSSMVIHGNEMNLLKWKKWQEIVSAQLCLNCINTEVLTHLLSSEGQGIYNFRHKKKLLDSLIKYVMEFNLMYKVSPKQFRYIF